MNQPSITVPVISVDGASGTGKGTVCSALARKLKWHLLDSGALYRVLALLVKQHNIKDEEKIVTLATQLDVAFEIPPTGEDIAVMLKGEKVNRLIRTEKNGNIASKIALLPLVRQALLQVQRRFRRLPGLVADGRDMGNVVFSDAQFKFFLTASQEERAKRRYKQLKKQGFNANLQEVIAVIDERDGRDTQRSVAPLQPADGAIVIDTTSISAKQVVDRIISLTREKRLAPSANRYH